MRLFFPSQSLQPFPEFLASALEIRWHDRLRGGLCGQHRFPGSQFWLSLFFPRKASSRFRNSSRRLWRFGGTIVFVEGSAGNTGSREASSGSVFFSLAKPPAVSGIPRVGSGDSVAR